MKMSDIKLITKDTDLTKIKMSKINWDIELGNQHIPYQLVRIPGFIHSIGGRLGDNDYWCYPRNEEPTYDNLTEYSASALGANWGIIMTNNTYTKCKWDESEFLSRKSVMITRNDKPFFECHSIHKALSIIDEIDEHPLELNDYNYIENMIGRKVWWRSEPAIITNWIGNGQACVILKPDGIDEFTKPAEFKDDDICFNEGEIDIKTTIFDNHIWWFRN